MRSAFLRLLVIGVLGLSGFAGAIGQSLPVEPAAKLLPDQIGEYKAAGAPAAPSADTVQFASGVTSGAARTYVSKERKKIWLTAFTTPSNSAAFALMTNARRAAEKSGSISRVDVGTAGFQQGNRLLFVRGPVLVTINPDGASQTDQAFTALGKEFATTIDPGEGDIPVLIKHLPNWESIQDRVLFALNTETLKAAISQPALDAVTLDGGAEAAVADYDGAKMVLIEFNTPQIASDNDQRINAKLAELRNQGQPLPTVYRRVGNYAVFVFDAPSEEVANQLVGQVKYQQMVQWLGENPYRYDRAVREFADTTLGVFVNVVKASGLVILGSLAIGGLLGAVLFSRRRAQQRAVSAYSDAGGMLRLNLDELPRPDPRRLLGPGTDPT
ncbi:MAG TPA: DUF6599 family protein [Pyrinomonadaceae bacterium]|nr:DUF6599 family protein [Pyrinomonadaceae bacterium]